MPACLPPLEAEWRARVSLVAWSIAMLLASRGLRKSIQERPQLRGATSHATTVIASNANFRLRRRARSHRQRDNCAETPEGPSDSRTIDLGSGCKIGLRDRNSPTCTLSQNGYGDINCTRKIYTAGHAPLPSTPSCAPARQWLQTGLVGAKLATVMNASREIYKPRTLFHPRQRPHAYPRANSFALNLEILTTLARTSAV